MAESQDRAKSVFRKQKSLKDATDDDMCAMAAGDILRNASRYQPVKNQQKVDEELTLDQLLSTSLLSSSLPTSFLSLNIEIDGGDGLVDSSAIEDQTMKQNKSSSSSCFSLNDDNDDIAFVYKMSSKERGCFLIFNQVKFDAHLKLRNRESSCRDAEALKELAEHEMRFAFVKIFESLTRDDIFYWLKKMADASHDRYDLFACAFLTHGDAEGVVYASDASFEMSQVYDMFTSDKCKTLAGKPKLFFVQACRGSKFDMGFNIQKLSHTSLNSSPTHTRLPVEADFLFAYSSVPNYVSWINDCGSWYFQALVSCVRRYRNNLDLAQILTCVNRMVATKCSTADGRKQMPCFTTTLTAQLYFK